MTITVTTVQKVVLAIISASTVVFGAGATYALTSAKLTTAVAAVADLSDTVKEHEKRLTTLEAVLSDLRDTTKDIQREVHRGH